MLAHIGRECQRYQKARNIWGYECESWRQATLVTQNRHWRPQEAYHNHKRQLVQVKKLGPLQIDTFNSATEEIQKNFWPGLEGTDGRFLPNPPDNSTRNTNIMIGKIRTRKEVQMVPVQIFPRPNYIIKALQGNAKMAQNGSFRL